LGLETNYWANVDRELWDGAPTISCKIIEPQAIGYSAEMKRLFSDFNPDILHVYGVWHYPSKILVIW
jgi:hypothetical protein